MSGWHHHLWAAGSIVVGLLLAMIVAGCREDKPAADAPVTGLDASQFRSPLELACWQEAGSWPQFAHDPLHSGRSGVELGSADLELAWQFRPTEHVWTYQPGFSVWSSPVAGTVAGKPLVIAGYYDSIVYAIDGISGEKIWEYRPGAPVFASPALGTVRGRPMVFVASRNRSIYGLDATSGDEIWQFETADWSFTQSQSVMSSPTLIDADGTALLVIGVWNSDRSASRPVQQGEIVVLTAANGQPQWRKHLGSSPLSSPAVARLDGDLTVFVSSRQGVVYALDLDGGSIKWQSVLNEETWSSPGVGMDGGLGRVFVGSRLNSVFGLDWRSGGRRWRRDAGYWIDSTPAWFVENRENTLSGRAVVLTGSYDRSFYAWASDAREPLWRAVTGNNAYSSVALATLSGQPVALGMSWDQNVYLFDGTTGQNLWQTSGGPLVWSHTYLGDSLWASPVIAKVQDRPTVLFPSFDGTLYAYRPASGQ